MTKTTRKHGTYAISQKCGRCGAAIYTTLSEHLAAREQFYALHPEASFDTSVPICDKCVRRMQRRLNKELKRIDKERGKQG